MWDVRKMEGSMEPGGYRRLEIYQRAHRLAVEVHRLTLTLPKFEMYEEGSQVRRSSKSVAAQIVEGYCLRKNKAEFMQYLNRAYASCHETLEHLTFLDETALLENREEIGQLREEYEALCKMIFRFLEGVSANHTKPGFVREGSAVYLAYPHPASRIPHPAESRLA
jgi:four helix bundle protein